MTNEFGELDERILLKNYIIIRLKDFYQTLVVSSALLDLTDVDIVDVDLEKYKKDIKKAFLRSLDEAFVSMKCVQDSEREKHDNN